MDIAVVVGNPRPRSRTYAAATSIGRKLAALCDGEIAFELDLITLGADLLTWGDPAISAAVAQVCRCDAIVVASPTFKATYTGLLKLFLDQIPSVGLAGTLALPVMLGAGPHHALSPELLLRPVLVELGAVCPVRGLYLLETDYESAEVVDPWLAQVVSFIKGKVAV